MKIPIYVVVFFFCFQSCVGEIFFVHKIYPRDIASHLDLRFKATVVSTNSFFTYTGKVNYHSRASIHKAFFIDIYQKRTECLDTKWAEGPDQRLQVILVAECIL